MKNNILLKLITPNEEETFEQVSQVTFRLADGNYTVLPNHARAVFFITPGMVRIFDGEEKYRVASYGTVRVDDNQVVLSSDFIVKEDDLERAELIHSKAIEEEKSHRARSYKELLESTVALNRALNHLEEKKD